MAKKRFCVPACLSWLEGTLPGRIQLHACGSESLMVENHKSVVEFTPECVKIQGARGIMTVEGDGLTLWEMRPGALIIRGEIRALALERGGAR